jgi:hypothetical protein
MRITPPSLKIGTSPPLPRRARDLEGSSTGETGQARNVSFYTMKWAIYPEWYRAFEDWAKNSPEGKLLREIFGEDGRIAGLKKQARAKALEQMLSTFARPQAGLPPRDVPKTTVITITTSGIQEYFRIRSVALS